MKSVAVPLDLIAKNGMKMVIHPHMWDWLVRNIGRGDPKFWLSSEEIEKHIASCDPLCCVDDRDGHCHYPSWGWSYPYQDIRTACVTFRKDSDAVMFKLRWFNVEN